VNVLIQQPEVDPKRINIIGHSECTIIAPRVAIDNSTKVKNIVLVGTVAQELIRDILHYQLAFLPSAYAKQVLDKNHAAPLGLSALSVTLPNRLHSILNESKTSTSIIPGKCSILGT
jgi:uncharacterized protein